MWAFACGIISSGLDISEHLLIAIVGILLAGPIICGMSQAINDWGDQGVDAINEPSRPIPSGRISSTQAFSLALFLSLLGLIIAWTLGIWVFFATLFAIFCAWAYSVEPIRLKKSGFLGPATVALCYEGVPWFTGAAVISKGLPSTELIFVASLYAVGAFGIMTLNDFKSSKGDSLTGVNSLPVVFGTRKAAQIACLVMTFPQLIIIFFLFFAGALIAPTLVSILLLIQLILMKKLLVDPKGLTPWYNATGVSLYVTGMMVSAIALRGFI